MDWSFTSDGITTLHVLVCRSTPAGYLQRLRDLGVGYFIVGYFIVGHERVDLRSALGRIRSKLRATRVIADSGGTLNASLLREGLVDGDAVRTRYRVRTLGVETQPSQRLR